MIEHPRGSAKRQHILNATVLKALITQLEPKDSRPETNPTKPFRFVRGRTT
jgi:hypothetical protein